MIGVIWIPKYVKPESDTLNGKEAILIIRVLECLKCIATDLEKFILYPENFPNELTISTKAGTDDSMSDKKSKISSA